MISNVKAKNSTDFITKLLFVAFGMFTVLCSIHLHADVVSKSITKIEVHY